ncbi:MAG: hypothetical protein DRJ98_01140 [Thermoprotei archaeon]|nr:MAG: hypothetical protein DRJ98_01140 [Thermoprotei archaeon]
MTVNRTALGLISGIIRMIRAPNSVMTGLAVITGMLIASKGAWSLELFKRAALGFTTGFMLCAAAMAVNDYYDREIDMINEPERPIPSGLVKPKEAIIVAAILSFLGLVSSAAINIECLAVAVIALAVAIGYATAGKATGAPGNVMVSFCVSLPFIYGGLTLEALDEALFVFASIAFLANMGREVTKGIVDVVGDAARGVKTIAAVYGRVKAAILSAIFYLAAVALSILPWLMRVVSIYYLPAVAVSDLGFIKASFELLRDPSRDTARRVKREGLLWMLIGLIAFIIGTNLH